MYAKAGTTRENERTQMSPEASASTFEERCIDTIRFLAVDAVQKANSGHPGMPLGAAPIAAAAVDPAAR